MFRSVQKLARERLELLESEGKFRTFSPWTGRPILVGARRYDRLCRRFVRRAYRGRDRKTTIDGRPVAGEPAKSAIVWFIAAGDDQEAVLLIPDFL